MNNSGVQRGIYRIIKKGKRTRTMIVVGSILLLLIVIVAIFIIVRERVNDISKKRILFDPVRGIFFNSLRGVEFDETSESEVKDKVTSLSNDVGIPPDEMEDALRLELAKDKQKNCNVSPHSNGLCGYGFSLENGCCYANESIVNKNAEKVALAKDIIKDVAISIAAGMVLEYMLKKGLGKAGGSIAAKAVAAGTSAARSALAAARAARAIATGTRIAAGATAKYSTAASTGPPGWIAAAVMVIFDAISVTLDLLDVDGYDSFTPQEMLVKLKNIIDYSMAVEFEKVNMEYPMMFPLGAVYPEEMELAQEYMGSQIVKKYSDIEMAKRPDVLKAYEDYIQVFIDTPDADPPIPPEYLDFIVQLQRDKHIERDKAIYTKMVELLGDQAYKIQFYESISGPDRMGISLSPEGAQEWNSSHEELWLKNNDIFKPPDPDTILVPDEPAACYTDTYYVYDSGPSDNPVMVPRKLPEKTVLCNYYGCLLAYCEKSRQLKDTSTSVNPKQLGVRFNFESGMCEFTKEFCTRYGLEFKNNDCKMAPGQNVAEIIFGRTITRASIREWQSRKDDFNSGDTGKVTKAVVLTVLDPTGVLTFGVKEGMKSYPRDVKLAKKGACPPGMRDDGMNCWLDTYTRDSRGMECNPDEEKKGELCYPECRDGYKSENLECESVCPDGSRNTGLTCLQGTKNHSFFVWEHRDRCYSKYGGTGEVSRGASTCNEPCLPGFTRRSNALGSAFCDKPRGRYSRFFQSKPLRRCPENHEKVGITCYENCKPKGEQGRYKYRGILGVCHPEDGAGIKKGLNDRWECPDGWENKSGICYEKCKEGERDDGLFCKRAG